MWHCCHIHSWQLPVLLFSFVFYLLPMPSSGFLSIAFILLWLCLSFLCLLCSCSFLDNIHISLIVHWLGFTTTILSGTHGPCGATVSVSFTGESPWLCLLAVVWPCQVTLSVVVVVTVWRGTANTLSTKLVWLHYEEEHQSLVEISDLYNKDANTDTSFSS